MDRKRDDETASGRRPSDTENLVGDTAASDSLTDPRHAVQPGEADAIRGSAKTGGLPEVRNESEEPDLDKS